jgi:hypothetical protein
MEHLPVDRCDEEIEERLVQPMAWSSVLTYRQLLGELAW